VTWFNERAWAHVHAGNLGAHHVWRFVRIGHADGTELFGELLSFRHWPEVTVALIRAAGPENGGNGTVGLHLLDKGLVLKVVAAPTRAHERWVS
jgi:hypothetical protein